MSVKRNAHTSKLRLHRLNSPRRFRGPSCRDTAPGSRRSCADGALNPLRRTKRTGKPPLRPVLRICRTAPWRAFFRRSTALPCAAPHGTSRRRRRRRQGDALHKPCTVPPRVVRAFASCSSPAPCAGGSRDSGRRIESLFPGLSYNGRALRRDFSRGRIRSGFARAQENPGRI